MAAAFMQWFCVGLLVSCLLFAFVVTVRFAWGCHKRDEL